MAWDLWVDYHRTGGDGLTHTNLRNVRPGVALAPGVHVVVGSEEAEPAVAQVVTVKPGGVVLSAPVRTAPDALSRRQHRFESRWGRHHHHPASQLASSEGARSDR